MVDFLFDPLMQILMSTTQEQIFTNIFRTFFVPLWNWILTWYLIIMIQYKISRQNNVRRNRRKVEHSSVSWHQLMVEMATNNDYVVLSVRILYTVVIGFGLLLAAITFHGFSPVLDPVAPVTFLDRISYWMGVHEKSSIVVVELGNC